MYKLWKILVNTQKYQSSYFLNQVFKLGERFISNMGKISLFLKIFQAILLDWFNKMIALDYFKDYGKRGYVKQGSPQ